MGEGDKWDICRDITNDQLGFSEETVFLRWESPYLLVHLMPSNGSSDNSGKVCHTTLLPHQGALTLVATFNILIIFYKNFQQSLYCN